ncbi:TPA: hypothetical protein RUZ16_000317 [Vibrio cholerae]|nr:hypothetical protein [Vibrio cholerae]
MATKDISEIEVLIAVGMLNGKDLKEPKNDIGESSNRRRDCMNIELPDKFKKTSLCSHVQREIEKSSLCETRRIEVKSIQSAIFLYSNIISKNIPTYEQLQIPDCPLTSVIDASLVPLTFSASRMPLLEVRAFNY